MNPRKGKESGPAPSKSYHGHNVLRLDAFDRRKTGSGGQPPDNPLIHNEQTKLTTAWLNTLGSASVTVGVITPLAAAIFGYNGFSVPAWNLILGTVILLTVGSVLHILARQVLRRLT